MPEATVCIESIAAGGDGVARHESLVIFVPRSAPGDRGTVTYVQRGNFARGRWRRIDHPSAHRIEPECPHYTRDRCGGCQLQHLEYSQQLRAKQLNVADALQRIARRDPPPVAMHASPVQWSYRRKLTLEIRSNGGGVIAGMHPYDDAAGIFQVDECRITMPEVMQAWKEILSNARFLPRARTLRGAVVVLDDGAHFSIGGGSAWDTAAELASACPSLRSIWWTRKGGHRELLINSGASAATGASFVQINDAVSTQLRSFVQHAALRLSPATVVDAYSGCGDSALPLAEAGVKVTAIETDEDAVDSFSGLLPSGSAAICGLVEDEIGAQLPTDLVLLNPPRSGVDEAVTKALSAPGAVAKGIIYVSCNPATLARDLSRLSGFAIVSVDCFDMFPQTSHVETVVVLAPPEAA